MKLEESELKAKKRLEQDFLFQLDAYLNSRVQFAASEDPKYSDMFYNYLSVLASYETSSLALFRRGAPQNAELRLPPPELDLLLLRAKAGGESDTLRLN